MKVLKIYLIDCPNAPEAQIYRIKHEISEDLINLKEKIYLRCPQLRIIQNDPQIYWYDLEDDKIMINCDDDLRFFMEEAQVTKLIVNFRCPQEMSRKRPLHDDECSESSKKIRRKLQQIDLDSDSDSMDTDDFTDKEVENQMVPKMNVTSTNNEEEIVASTSKSNPDSNSPKVNILNVEIIEPVDELDGGATSSQQNDQSESIILEQNDTQENSTPKRNNSESNKIVISDSSDEEEQPRNNRRHSDGLYSSSYSFTSANNVRFEPRTSFDDDYRRFNHHRHYNHHFRQRLRDEHIQNMARMHQNAQIIRENVLRNAEAIRESTVRNIRNSANIFPQILSTFQAHFRPLFQQPGFNQQQYNRNFRR